MIVSDTSKEPSIHRTSTTKPGKRIRQVLSCAVGLPLVARNRRAPTCTQAEGNAAQMSDPNYKCLEVHGISATFSGMGLLDR
jgi:hypothetical protein